MFNPGLARAVFGEIRRMGLTVTLRGLRCATAPEGDGAKPVSYGLPFAGMIFYGEGGFATCELDNHIIIKGLAVSLCLWRAV
jgi:hypothetical protein